MTQKKSVKSPAAKQAKPAAKVVSSPPVKTTGSRSSNAEPAPVPKRAAAKPSDAGKSEARDVVPAQAKEKAQSPALPKGKVKKPKLVRDSFTMPEDEYKVLGEVKKACIKAGFEVKKSELLRVGVALIRKMDVPALQSVLSTLPPLKAGRPKREK